MFFICKHIIFLIKFAQFKKNVYFCTRYSGRFLYNLRAFSSLAEVDKAVYILGGQNVKCLCWDSSYQGKGRNMDKKEQIWTVVRTFNRHELMVSEFLKQEGLTCFIPMQYAEKVPRDDAKPKRVLVPVIHNYVFVSLTMPLLQLGSILAKCTTPLYILKNRDTDQPVEISNREMLEFRMLCDPAFEQQISVTQQEKELDVGKEVEIIHGPFAGIHGRLYRKQKKYWFVKTIAGVSVELRITRWFCRPL